MYYFIEPMTEADIPAVQQIERQSFSTPWSANTYRRELRNHQMCRYIVARVSATPPPPPNRQSPRLGGLLGQLFSSLFPPTDQNHTEAPIVGYGGVWLTVDDAHITTIAVDPSHRSRGIGELLLNALIDHAYELHARMLTLEVRVSNTVAQRLYVKYGFQPGGTRPRYYTDNNEDALIMWTEAIDSAAYKAQLAELRKQLFARLRSQAENTTA
ncbi:MAG: ribosomal protein S18-alanine N-acetyltransferase [Oscillochloris sp.]|nr:ribosomal protein S18-alanine N-acetyltransferase [Oscillochloris sp.]